MIPGDVDGDVTRWPVPDGGAAWDAARRTWRRPGLEVGVDAGHVVLRPDLDDGDVIAVLDPPLAVAPDLTATVRLAWPLPLVAQAGGVTIDRFRAGARRGLLGTFASGRVVPAVRPVRLEGEVVPSPWEAILRLRVATRTGGPEVLRRFVVPEDSLDLWRGPDGWMVGDVVVEILGPERALARADTPTLPGDVERVERPNARPRLNLFAWSSPDARAVEFLR